MSLRSYINLHPAWLVGMAGKVLAPLQLLGDVPCVRCYSMEVRGDLAQRMYAPWDAPGGALYLFSSRENNGYFVRKAVQRGFTYRNQIVMVKKMPLPSFSKGISVHRSKSPSS